MTTKMKQIKMQRYGDPSVLELIETSTPQPQKGEVLIAVEAIGVNYSDTLRRKNIYFQPTPLPYVLGTEAVGKIIALGEDADPAIAIGSTVLALLPFGGGYAEYVTVNAQYCVPLPPHIHAQAATGIFVQGSTAQLMISDLAGEINNKYVLINAAAGGVGSMLVQLAKMKGAKVIAACGTEDKMKIALQNGADFVVNYSLPHWSEKVKAITDNTGVDVAFEPVGGEVYNETIKSLAMGGHIIVFGCASGMQGQIHPEYFVDNNLRQSGFNLAFYVMNKTPQWQAALGEIIGAIAQQKLIVSTPITYPLAKAATAHQAIEARETTGKVVLIP